MMQLHIFLICILAETKGPWCHLHVRVTIAVQLQDFNSELQKVFNVLRFFSHQRSRLNLKGLMQNLNMNFKLQRYCSKVMHTSWILGDELNAEGVWVWKAGHERIARFSYLVKVVPFSDHRVLARRKINLCHWTIKTAVIHLDIIVIDCLMPTWHKIPDICNWRVIWILGSKSEKMWETQRYSQRYQTTQSNQYQFEMQW